MHSFMHFYMNLMVVATMGRLAKTIPKLGSQNSDAHDVAFSFRRVAGECSRADDL